VEKSTKAVSVLSSRLQVQSNVTSLSCFIQLFFVCWFAPAGAFNCANNGVIVTVPWSRETPIPHPVPLGPSVLGCQPPTEEASKHYVAYALCGDAIGSMIVADLKIRLLGSGL
jgi:hypothetical protein